MKKFIGSCLFLFISVFTFAQNYKITSVNYELTESSWKFLGTTKPYALEQNVPVDKEKIFTSLEEFELYLNDYRKRLANTRAFEKIDVTYTVTDSQDNSQKLITINVKTTDSVHLLGLPYPKYNSNDGFTLKLKAKDTNFLGSLNTMASDINFCVDENKDISFGINFSYDYPYKSGIFNATCVNDLSFDWTIGNESPEWDVKTGLKYVLPKNRISYIFEFYQSFANNLDYKIYNDNMYFCEDFKFSSPIVLYKIENFSSLTYTPFVQANFNWDFDGISDNNKDLSGPNICIGHSISIGRINWSNNFRDGFNSSFDNTFSYNFQRKILYPSITFETTGFKSFKLFDNKYDIFNRLGICADLYTNFVFVDFDNPYFGSDGTNIGSRLRGILDNQTTTDTGFTACQSPASIVLNLDFPYHLFSTNFTGNLFKYFNFDLQISPFIDIGLLYNKSTKTWFNPKDGFYGAGLEILVYPAKWSSFTVRASLGIDIGREFFSDYINTSWRDDVSTKEISIGIGLHY